ncbi:uncharacterized protein isoform X3 [Musca autumnalis]|uniref:uncharacterized protein isoform X3 n=1 Tax=Musca autumnalis TaxID=221902 RepID=UPI003CF853A1
MSDHQESRRTSSRSTQGIPPARFDPETYDMSVAHSPKSNTPSRSQQNEPEKTLSVNMSSANKANQPPLHGTTPQNVTNSPATTSKSSNELADFKKQIKMQMDAIQKQMQQMQTQFFNNSQMQAQFLETATQMQSQLATQISTLQSQPALPLLQQQSQILHNQASQSQVNMPQTIQPQFNMPQTIPPQQVCQQQPAPQGSLQQPLSQHPPAHTRTTPSSSITSEMSVHNSTSHSLNSIPHKKIYPLPIFTGLPEEWCTFFESFTTTTAEFGYSNLHNIMRLRDALKGRAREAVESLLGNSANVDAILELLEETFGRPEQLIRSQIEKVRAIPPVQNDNLDALVNYANKISNMATFLQNAKGEHHLSNPSLLSELVSKLSTNRQMQWAEKCMNLDQPATIVDFSKWLSTLRRLANMVHDTQPISSNRRHLPAAVPPSSRKFAGVAQSHQCSICMGDCFNIKNCPSFLQMSVEDRWNKIKQIKTCFCCLRRGHQVKTCNMKRRCGINDCQKPHHTLLHNPMSAAMQTDRTTTTNNLSQHNENSIGTPQTLPERRNCHATCDTENVLFQLLPVTLYGKHKNITVYAFVDDGANVSMLHTDVLHGEDEYLELQWLNNHRTSQKTKKIRVTLSGTGRQNKKFTISNIYLSADLSLPVQSCHMAHILKSQKYQEIEQIPVGDYSNVRPMMILSLQHAFLTVPLETPRLLSEFGPIVTLTRLGAIIYGPIPGDVNNYPKRALHFHRCSRSEDAILEEMTSMMRNYFDTETLRVKINTKPLMSDEDKRALDILESETKRVDGRYECPLLWKKDVPPLPSSYNMALNRLYSVEQKMQKDEDYASKYKSKIEHYVKEGYCRKLTTDEDDLNDRTFYIPHFGVKNPNKKGIRLVFDAAAEVEGVALNKCLLSGPDINNPLITILFKFREGPIAVCADIQEMFHQIAVKKADQNCQRFLWRDGDVNKPVETYVMERLIFGATCSPTIAQFVKNLNAKNFLDDCPRAVHGIIDRHYVDDYVDCFSTEEEAIRTLTDVIKIHKFAGFNLHGVKSNSQYITKQYGNPTDEGEISGNTFINDGVERVLGIRWVPKTDVFCFDLKVNKVDGQILKCEKVPTKREMLSLNMSIYDPFGFICDFMVTTKIIMQRVWKCGIKWDDKLPPEIYCQWRVWLEQLQNIVKFKMQVKMQWLQSDIGV